MHSTLEKTSVRTLQYCEGIVFAVAELPGYVLQVVLRHVHVAEAMREI